MTPDDPPLFAKWVKVPAVAEWWREEAEMSFEELRRKMDPRTLGAGNVRPYIFEFDGSPAGYIQTYAVDSEPDAVEMFRAPGAWAVDLFIGEERWLHRGLGR
jgi:aminoglycoside 6'-N-acetyltransferase